MTWLVIWRSPAVLRYSFAVGFALLFIGIFLVLVQAKRQSEASRMAFGDDIVWYTSRFEAELMRLSIALDIYDHEPDASFVDSQRRFDIIWSRLNYARVGTMGRILLDLENASETLDFVTEGVKEIELLLPKLEARDPEAKDRVRALTVKLLEPLRRLSTEATRQRVIESDQARELYFSLILTIETLTAGLIILGLSLLTHVQREKRQIDKARAELEVSVQDRTRELTERSVELERLNHELARANENLAQFAQIASHDLQEPLRKIALYSELLAREIPQANAEAHDALRVIQSSARRERVLVADLLTYSKNVNRPLNLQPIDLTELFHQELTQELMLPLNEASAALKLNGPFPTIHADRMQALVLFRNIVGNAIKYRANGRPTFINIGSVKSPNSGCRITIADNGIGFENKYADVIFQPFKRLHREVEYPGTGIGLALCRNIADRHGWTISASGIPDQGAVFAIDIPKAEAA